MTGTGTGTASGYARPMPALGFDPAPGDPVGTARLGRQYNEIAAVLDQIQATIGKIDLTRWHGKAGDTARARLAALSPMLDRAASTARHLSSITANWSTRLAAFQAEADALEHQAAAQIAEQQALTTMRTRFAAHATATRATATPVSAAQPGTAISQLSSDITRSATALAAIRAQAAQLHQDYLATARAQLSQRTIRELWHDTEGFRTAFDAVLAPLDIAGADHWIKAARDFGELPATLSEKADQKLADIRALIARGAPLEARSQAIREAARMLETDGAKLAERAADVNPRLLRLAEENIQGFEIAERALGTLGILNDLNTIISPEDSGNMGWADRGAATLNGVLIGLDMVGVEIPVVGPALLAATGLYLAGDFLYHHWTPFRDVANDIGHATVQVSDELGHDASSGWHSVTSSVGSWF